MGYGLWVIGYREGMKGYWLLGEEKKRGEDGRGVKKNAYLCTKNCHNLRKTRNYTDFRE